jgi:hypothetical protein
MDEDRPRDAGSWDRTSVTTVTTPSSIVETVVSTLGGATYDP